MHGHRTVLTVAVHKRILRPSSLVGANTTATDHLLHAGPPDRVGGGGNGKHEMEWMGRDTERHSLANVRVVGGCVGCVGVCVWIYVMMCCWCVVFDAVFVVMSSGSLLFSHMVIVYVFSL